MRRTGELQNPRHVAHVVPGILRQFRRRDQPHQIDDPLEVRRPRGREAPAQVLPSHVQLCRDRLGPHRPPAVCDDRAPRALLNPVVEPERQVRIVQRRAETSRETLRHHEVANGRVIHPLDQDIGEIAVHAA